MPGQEIKSLKLLAKEIQSNLQKYAPIDTDNLRNRLSDANSLNKIIKKTSYSYNAEVKSIDVGTISVEIAPQGAEYGLWFNDPPAPRSKRRKSLQKTAERKGNWNFGQRSIDDAIYKYLDKFAAEIEENMAKDLEDRLSKL